MQFRGQPAAGATQRMIGWFLAHPAGWFSLQIPFLRAPAACWCARAVGGAGKILKKIQAWLSIRRQDVRRR
jgi:hypothetical protein